MVIVSSAHFQRTLIRWVYKKWINHQINYGGKLLHLLLGNHLTFGQNISVEVLCFIIQQSAWYWTNGTGNFGRITLSKWYGEKTTLILQLLFLNSLCRDLMSQHSINVKENYQIQFYNLFTPFLKDFNWVVKPDILNRRVSPKASIT